ncbi:hypothetical protein [Polyangium jinanense]|uniref:Uncharacterized protein n=1 Tax=Polyangium jinanense TaxID=2829994 RepID=A0A9X4AXA1_9BACT|nr:hypothetical protein [Polyangium jinanense]MDC3962840.1 hypothetical protein [Polyangium jinanense]MDC3988298.1 hypothetical protein [Polyangium jinanense]
MNPWNPHDRPLPHDAPVQDRLRRDPPARTQPIRDVPLIFRSPPERRPDPMPGPNGPGAPNGRPSLEAGVSTAYRVYDEYMRRGREAARGFGGSWPEAGPPPSYGDMARRAMRYWSDAIGMMFDFAGPMGFMPQGRAPQSPYAHSPYGGYDPRAAYAPQGRYEPPPPYGRPEPPAPFGRYEPPPRERYEPPRERYEPPRPPQDAPEREAGIALRFDVHLGRAAEVRLHLGPGATGKHLVAPALAALDVQGALPLEGVRFSNDGALGLTLQIPPEQPAGTYSGVVIDETSRSPVGRVTVTLKA